jgi:hypothetical protein
MTEHKGDSWVPASEAAEALGVSRLRIGWLCYSEDLVYGRLRNRTWVEMDSLQSYKSWREHAVTKDLLTREAMNVAIAPIRFVAKLFKTAARVPWN